MTHLRRSTSVIRLASALLTMSFATAAFAQSAPVPVDPISDEGPYLHFEPTANPLWPISPRPYIDVHTDATTYAAGPTANGSAMITLPFTYKRVLHAKAASGHSLGGGYIPADSYGFDAGEFGGPRYASDLRCFFSLLDRNPYAKPHCYGHSEENSGRPNRIAFTGIHSNLPDYIEMQSATNGPVVEAGDFKIDHNFAVVISVTKWSGDRAHIIYTSDGVKLTEMDARVQDDGAVAFPINGGVVKFRPVAADPGKTDVTFTPAAK